MDVGNSPWGNRFNGRPERNRRHHEVQEKKVKRRIVSLSVVALMMMTMVMSAQAEEVSIGIVDFQRVLKESVGGKKAKAEIETKGRAMEEELKKKGDELEQIKKKLEAEAMVMNDEARSQKERDFRIKVGDFKDMQKRYATEFKKFEADVIQRVQKQVFDLVEDLGKKNGYTVILERAMVLYHAGGSIDLTDQLIKRYDAVAK